jgi:hypothetical protein
MTRKILKIRMKEPNFVPVKKVLVIINSCETSDQLDSCLGVIDNYVKQVKRKGVVNTDLLKKRLMKEYSQKCFQIKMIKSFIRRDQEEFTKEFNKEIVNVG